ncbi:MAG: cytidylate kinase [Rhodospirillaceae bacterium]|nr:cytidylate kinase [Rhodospirillaceae bacterium]
MTSPVIAVDGTAASGKGTLARRLATALNYAYLDTGLLYRATGFLTASLYPNSEKISEEIAIEAVKAITPETMENPALRDEKITQRASMVAAIPAVRTALIEQQRNFAKKPPGDVEGAILDGRDIGTVICPEADYKIFVDADVETRADRRVKELRERGVDAIHARVLQDMRERDTRDSSRSVAPLVPAEDAFILDTTTMDADAVFATALEFISKRNESKA